MASPTDALERDDLLTVAPAPPAAEQPLPSTSAVCEQCGAPVEPGDRFCPSCGSGQAAAAPSSSSDVPQQRRFRCNNCGAEVAVDPNQRSYVCAFCGSTYVVEFDPAESQRQPPEFVIGFAIAPESAQEKFRHWLADNGWFRPADLRMATIVEKLRGVYLPFWSFSMLAQSRWSAKIGEYWYRTEHYTTTENGKLVHKTRRVQETEWWPLQGGHHAYYSGYLVSGSRGLPHEMAQRIMPFQLPALKRYAPYFLAGWMSEEYSVPRDAALVRCQQEFAQREQGAVAGYLPGDTHSQLQVHTNFSQVNSDLILLPVYLLSYRYNDRVYRFLMNGQTGRMDGDKPVSTWRIGAAVAAGLAAALAAAFLIWWMTR